MNIKLATNYEEKLPLWSQFLWIRRSVWPFQPTT